MTTVMEEEKKGFVIPTAITNALVLALAAGMLNSYVKINTLEREVMDLKSENSEYKQEAKQLRNDFNAFRIEVVSGLGDIKLLIEQKDKKR